MKPSMLGGARAARAPHGFAIGRESEQIRGEPSRPAQARAEAPRACFAMVRPRLVVIVEACARQGRVSTDRKKKWICVSA
jgi:hypothetical protein